MNYCARYEVTTFDLQRHGIGRCEDEDSDGHDDDEEEKEGVITKSRNILYKYITHRKSTDS